MKNQDDIQFTPSPALGTQEVGFTPDPGLGAPATGGASYQGQSGQTSTQGGPLDQAKSKAQQLVSTATDRATSQITSRLDDQKLRAADTLSGVAENLRNTSRQFEGMPDGLTQYIDQAADRVEDVARYLHDREVAEIVDQVEELARRQPAVFLGGAFALGILGARFLKSSRSNLVRYEVRERWDTRELTGRVDDPERDAIGRPMAPGYAPPSERSTSDYKAAGPRE